MLNISGFKRGFVLDHIQAGRSMDIYFKLGLDKLDCQVAIIKNARSSKMGRKDIIKIDGSLDLVNVDVLGYIDHRITINIIKDGKNRRAKKDVKMPEKKSQMSSTARTRAALPRSSRSFRISSISRMRKKRYTAASTVMRSIRCKFS